MRLPVDTLKRPPRTFIWGLPHLRRHDDRAGYVWSLEDETWRQPDCLTVLKCPLYPRMQRYFVITSRLPNLA